MLPPVSPAAAGGDNQQSCFIRELINPCRSSLVTMIKFAEGGGAACQRGAATCWNGRDAPSTRPGDAGTARHRQGTGPGLSTFVCDHPSSLSCPMTPDLHFSTFVSDHPSSLSCPCPHSHPFSIFVSDHPSSLSCPCPPAHPFSSFLSAHPSSPSCPCPAHPFSISTIPVWYAGLKWKC